MTARYEAIRDPSQPAIAGDYQYRALRSGPRLQRFWHREKLSVMSQLLPIEQGDIVVDIGCGSGNLTVRAGESTTLAFGVDPSLEATRFCRSRPDARACGFATASGYHLPFEDACADAVLLVEVIEHLTDPPGLLSEAHRILRPGGRLLATTPNYGAGSLWPLLEWVADRSGLVAEMAEEQHVKLYDPNALVRELSGSGFSVEQLGSFYRWSPLAALLRTDWANAAVADEVASGRLDGSIVFAVARRGE